MSNVKRKKKISDVVKVQDETIKLQIIKGRMEI